MQFLAPAFLLGLAAIAIPIWIHFARQHRAPVVPFTAVDMIRAAPVEQRSTRRLRDLFLLAVRAAAVALLALAFARPYLAAGAMDMPVTLVAVDVSGSMGGPERFGAARAAAHAAIDAAPASHRVGVAAFDHRGRIALLPQADRAAAHAAVDRLEAGFGATRYAAAFAGASDAFGASGGTLVVVSDRQQAGWAGETTARVPVGVEVTWAAVEPPARNIAVTALTVRANRLRATVVNSGREAVETTARLMGADGTASEGAAIGARTIRIGAGETQVVEFGEPLPPSGAVAVAVADPGGVAADDTRYLVLGAAPARRVLVITSGVDEGREAYYLRHALAATPAAGAPSVTVAGGTSLREGLGDALANVDVVVVLSTRGIERSGPPAIEAFRARGGGVLLVAGPSAEPAVLAEMLDAGETRAVPGTARRETLVLSDARHPLFASLGPLAGALGAVRVTRAMFIEAPRLAVLARFTDGAPALVERRRQATEGRTLLVATDLSNTWNDLALHPAFVPLAHEMVAHLDGRPRRAAEYLIGDPAAPTARPGVMAAAPGETSLTAVNVDPAESESAVFLDADARARVAVDDRHEQRAATARREREADNPLWRYAIVAMMAMLLIEGVAGRSRAQPERSTYVGT